MTKPTLAVGIAAVVLVAGAAGVLAFGGGEMTTTRPEVVYTAEEELYLEGLEYEGELVLPKTDLSDWNTYKNDAVGITFKYPSTYLIEAEEDDREEFVVTVSASANDFTNTVRISERLEKSWDTIDPDILLSLLNQDVVSTKHRRSYAIKNGDRWIEVVGPEDSLEILLSIVTDTPTLEGVWLERLGSANTSETYDGWKKHHLGFFTMLTPPEWRIHTNGRGADGLWIVEAPEARGDLRWELWLDGNGILDREANTTFAGLPAYVSRGNDLELYFEREGVRHVISGSSQSLSDDAARAETEELWQKILLSVESTSPKGLEDAQNQVLNVDREDGLYREESSWHGFDVPTPDPAFSLVPGEQYGTLTFEGVYYSSGRPQTLSFTGQIELEGEYFYTDPAVMFGGALLFRNTDDLGKPTRDDLSPSFYNVNLNPADGFFGEEDITKVRVVLEDPTIHSIPQARPSGVFVSGEVLIP